MRHFTPLIMLTTLIMGGCATNHNPSKPISDDGLISLHSTSIQLTCAPHIGRVMWFSRTGESNLLWNNPAAPDPTIWSNYGGDKSWPWPQDVLWQWPPPKAIDPGSYVAASWPEGFQLNGSADPFTGLAASRQTTVAGDIARHIYTFTQQSEPKRSGDRPAVAAWAISQIPAKGTVYIRVSNASDAHAVSLSGAALSIQSAGPHWLQVLPAVQSGKIGVAGDAVAARIGDRVLLIERSDTIPPSDPSAAMTAQVYAYREGAAGDQYNELELIGPSHKLAVGESTSLHTQWRILDCADFDRMLASH